jgi:hypothetical protein
VSGRIRSADKRSSRTTLAALHRGTPRTPDPTPDDAGHRHNESAGYWTPLFVALDNNTDLDDGPRDRITAAIRSQAYARHLPDAAIAVPASRAP